MTDRIGRLARSRNATPPRHLYLDLGPQRLPFPLSNGNPEIEREVLFEVSDHWAFALAAACFARTPVLRLPLAIWQCLQPGRYYARLTDLATARVERIWSWQKL
jgi:hypothetical protein